jgi:dihydroorotate dehydrogenase
MNYKLFRKLIYRLDPETAHNIVETMLRYIGDYLPFLLYPVRSYYKRVDCRLSQDILGIRFDNPVGLGAGFDKDATMIKALESVGFGYLEVGTVTPKPQDGNPKPRVFRYVEHNSLQNAMGFNNHGLSRYCKRLKNIYPYKIPIGANIGKNKNTANQNSIEDYRILIEGVKDICDYIVINISSPNTPGLRDLQNEQFIKDLFELAKSISSKPIFLKVAPDIDIDSAKSICRVAIDSGANGIIATNTTTDYSLLPGARDFGGISGEALRIKSYEFFKELSREFYGKTILISVGGINSAKEAYSRIRAGASLVQVYSGLIFEGPILVQKINYGLLKLIKEDGFKSITEAIGADLK